MTVRDAERVVIEVARTGWEWNEMTYEEFHRVYPDLPSWEGINALLESSPTFAQFIPAELAKQQPTLDPL